MNRPVATVIVPTYKRDASLANSLRQLFAQRTDAAFEVLVVDQTPGGSPLSRAVLAGDPRGRYLETTPPNLPRARNVGVREARGEIVLFIDDDVDLPDTWLAAHLRNYAEPAVHAVGGRITDVRWPGDKGDFVGEFSWWGRDRTNLDHCARARVLVAGGGNFSVRKTSYEAIGGFDERFGDGTALREESDFFLRLHRRFGGVVFDPEARLTHLAAGSGGCRAPRHAQAPALYRNETLFFLKNFRPAALPLYLALSWAKHAVVHPWQNGELNAATLVRATVALARGAVQGLFLARESAP